MTCKHEHGAPVGPLAPWVCGQCFAKLEERPKRYGYEEFAVTDGADGRERPRQKITWQSDVRKSADGLTLADFLRTMAKRYQRRCKDPISDNDAYGIALDMLKAMGEEFADPALDWSHEGARELADEDMQEWEYDDATGANA